MLMIQMLQLGITVLVLCGRGVAVDVTSDNCDI